MGGASGAKAGPLEENSGAATRPVVVFAAPLCPASRTMPDPRDLNDLQYFARVVEHGGFAAAGRALGLPKSRLSRRIALLEERLGVRLIQRSTRRFLVTDTGQTYYEHCRAMLAEADAADEAVARVQAEPRGTVRMACPIALLQVDVAPMLASFMLAHPSVEIHLEETNRRVDVLAEGLDLAIRVRPPPIEDSDLAMRVLAHRSQVLVAAPRLLPAGALSTPADLAAVPSLALGQPQHEHRWDLLGPDGTTASVRHRPRLVTRDMPALRTAAIAGVGVVQLPAMLLRDAMAAGDLIRALPGWAPRREVVHVVFPSRRGLLPSVRSLVDHLARCFAALGDD